MDAKQMKDCVVRLYNEVYTKGQLSVCDELCDPNVKFHDLAAESYKPGVSAFKESEKAYHKAFPKKEPKIEDIFVNDDKVVVRWSCKGKHEGELQGVAATHRHFKITGISIYQFKSGKISEVWQSWDRLSLLEQLGIAQPVHALH